MPDPKVWEDIRRAYEDHSIPTRDITDQFDVAAKTIYERVIKENWLRRPSPFPAKNAARISAPPPALASPLATARKLAVTPIAQRRALVRRLYAAIDTKLKLLERRFAREMASLDDATGEASSAADNERDTRAIGTLIKTLEQVTEYDHGHEHGKRIPGGSAANGLHGAAAKSASLAASALTDEADRLRRELGERLQRVIDTPKT